MYKNLGIDENLLPHLKECEIIYREAHPELNQMKLSKSKILYEIVKYYLRGTRFKLE